MNRQYVAFYDRQKFELSAASAYEAQVLAKDYFQKKFPRKKVRGYDVAVALADVPVDPAILPGA